MRTNWCIWIVVLVVGAVCSAAQGGAGETTSSRDFAGTWTGTWEGDGRSGGLDLTLEAAADGRLSGHVAVTGDPAYKAALRTVSFDGARMTARYDFPEDDASEVVLAGTFDGTSAKGTWSARVKANNDEVARGTWTVSRK